MCIKENIMRDTLQQHQLEWVKQWNMFQDNELSLFEDWIKPFTLLDLQGKEVLEAGCGGGQHTSFMAFYAKKIVAVDLNTIAIAKQRNKNHQNIEFVEADIAKMDLQRKFDVVISIGVIHHTDDPDQTVLNLMRHVRVGGQLILWVYSREGNFLVKFGVEPLRRLFLQWLPRSWVYRISQLITVLISIPIFSLYQLPLPFLPFYQYFCNFRKLSFSRNVLNVFDKLNAPQVQFITKKRAESWFSHDSFEQVNITSYCGVSWRVSARRK